MVDCSLITTISLSDKGPCGVIVCCVPLTAPTTALSHRSLCGFSRSPCEYISSGSVSDSSSVGNHGNLECVVGSVCVALAQLPTCVVGFPPVSPPAGSAEFDLPSLLPVAPASEVSANAVVCLTGAVELGLDVAGPSLPVSPHVTTMVVLFQSGLKVFQNLHQHDAGCSMASMQVVSSPR